jgi:hypothetical protein
MAHTGKQHGALLLRNIGFAVAAACFCVLPAERAAGQASEYQVKTAYMYQFLNFVVWPASAFPANDSPFEICILGADPFGAELDNMVRGKQVRGRSVHVQRLASPPSARRCHILFIAVSERTRLAWILEAVSGLPLLTVSELRDFEQQGGMVRFVVEHDNVRLRINPDSSAAAGVEISSKLLGVSTVVHGRSGG